MNPAFAQDHSGHEHHSHHNHEAAGLTTPAGIMGNHMHKKGEWMLSYNAMRMGMNGNRDGRNNLSPEQISGDVLNTTGSGPATMRIVPLKMTMDMHMLGAMYAPTDWLTLMAMGNYVDKDMTHATYMMGNPDREIGRFKTHSEGFGDTKLGGLFSLYQGENRSLIAKAGVSLPTGNITEDGIILNPMGVRQRIRLPYAMQLGSGTYDFEPALTYTGHAGKIEYGAQYNATIRIGDNDEGYTLGDKHGLTSWLGYGWSDRLGTTLRLSAEREADIDGRDLQIAGPVPTADPDNYGGKRIEAGFGLNFEIARGSVLTSEFTAPLYQDLNGPQMKRDYALTLGYQLRF